MSTIDERCFGHEPASSDLVALKEANNMQSKRIDWTVQDNIKKAIEIDNLNKARLKDAVDHEDTMRVLIKIMSKRLDIIRNSVERADNWQANAIRLAGRIKIL